MKKHKAISTTLRRGNISRQIFTFRTLWGDSSGDYRDSTFPQHSWFLKAYKEETEVDKERNFNEKLCIARVVTENYYGMLKERWRILYKSTGWKLDNLKYVIMSCILLHNICILLGGLCEPRWRLEVQQLEFFPRSRPKKEDPNESIENYKLVLEITVQSILWKVPGYSKKDSFSCHVLWQ